MCDETGGCRSLALLLRAAGNFRGVCPIQSGERKHAGVLIFSGFRFCGGYAGCCGPGFFQEKKETPGHVFPRLKDKIYTGGSTKWQAMKRSV